MKRCLTGFFLLLLSLTALTASAEHPVQQQLPYPKNVKESNVFSISQSGGLMVLSGEHWQIWDGDSWSASSDAPLESALAVKRTDENTLQVFSGAQIHYATRSYDTIYPVDNEHAYVTQANKLYTLNMQTGHRELLCVIDGLWDEKNNEPDFADGLLVTSDTVYVLFSAKRAIYTIDLAWAWEQSKHKLVIAETCAMDIGTEVLKTTEHAFRKMYPDLLVDRVRLSPVQVLEELGKTPAAFDFVIADTASWNLFHDQWADLSQNPQLLQVWDTAWHDMRALCTDGNIWRTVPLWDNVNMLVANRRLANTLGISLPSSDWTWDDFLTLARQCRQNGNAYVASRQMRFIDEVHDMPVISSLITHQVAVLVLSDGIAADDPRILHAMEVWKTCVNEGLLADPISEDNQPDQSSVLFFDLISNSWYLHNEDVEQRIVIPSIAVDLACLPAQPVFIGINQTSARQEAAADFLLLYLRSGADEHGYLISHTFEQQLGTRQGWSLPTSEHITHFEAAFRNARRDVGDGALYEAMEASLARYVTGDISAQVCTEEWLDALEAYMQN